MKIEWLTWSNPVAVWWGFLSIVSAANIALFLSLRMRLRARTLVQCGIIRIELLTLLCAAYVFGCAFRSVLPRADVQRICLFDTWLSSILVGRSVATVAEVCFIIQWSIVLRILADNTRSDMTRRIAGAIVPLILLAECCSWYAVLTTNYLGNAIENSLWAVAFFLVAVALTRLVFEFRGVVRVAITAALVGTIGYLAFLLTIDVPMYFDRWQVDLAAGKEPLDALAGLYDVATNWVVSHDINEWKDEIAWMSLYFTGAVWSSLVLCGFAFFADTLSQYRRVEARRGSSVGAIAA
jgi:hypothetical protein